jgi:hypothetical protein
VRLAEDLREEELDPPRVVGPPVVRVRLLPALVALALVGEAGWQRPRQGRADRHHPGGPLRVPGRELQGVPTAHRQPDDHGAVDAQNVHDGDGVVDVLVVGVRGVGTRAVRDAVAPALDRDHPEPPGQRRDLQLPLAHVHDRPRGEQQQRRPSRPEQGLEDLVSDTDAVPLDGADGVRLACAHGGLPSVEISVTPRDDQGRIS